MVGEEEKRGGEEAEWRRGKRENVVEAEGREEGGVPECQRLLEASTIIDTLCSGTRSITSELRSPCRSCQPGGPRSTQVELRPLAPPHPRRQMRRGSPRQAHSLWRHTCVRRVFAGTSLSPLLSLPRGPCVEAGCRPAEEVKLSGSRPFLGRAEPN